MKENCILVKVLPQDVDIPKRLKSIIESLRYVTIDQLKIGKKKVHELEIGEVISFEHIHYGRKYMLKCSTVTNEVELHVPGYIEDNIQTAASTISQSKKRFVSVSNEDGNLKKKTSNARETSQSIIEDENSLINIPVVSGNQIEAESSVDNDKDQIDSSKIDSNQSDSQINSSLNDISINKMFELAKDDKYPKKIVIIDNVECKFTSILNFFQFTDRFNTLPNTNIKFNCKICKKYLKCKLAKTTNLNKHLKTHDIMNKWYTQYQVHQNMIQDNVIDDSTLLLIKFFISSNTALSALKNQWLRELLVDKVKLPGPVSFRNTILPAVYKSLRKEIEKRLQAAETICLITDLWTNKQNDDFIALCGVITNKFFEREILVVDMIPMLGASHTAENIKAAIEKMVS